MIPKRIFQTWKEKPIRNEILKSWQNSWIENNPSYQYTFWDDKENRQFIEENFPHFLPIYDNYDVNIKRVDAVRYFYLFKYGGIYADLDFVCLKPFDDVTKLDADVVLGHLGEMDNPMNSNHSIPNAIMISKENADFFRFVTIVLQNIGNVPNISPEVATGPILLKFCLKYYTTKTIDDIIIKVFGKNIFENLDGKVKFDSNIVITSPSIFYPINWDNKNHLIYRQKPHTNAELCSTFPESYAATFWMHSW